MINVCVSREYGCCECLEGGGECPNCQVGDNISNNLIKTKLVADSAGRALLDEEHTNKRIIRGSCSLHHYMKPKSLVQVTDRIHGTYIGKLSKFSLSISTGPEGQLSARSSVEVVKVHE